MKRLHFSNTSWLSNLLISTFAVGLCHAQPLAANQSTNRMQEEASGQMKSGGAKNIQNADGSTIQVNPDGSKMIKKPDGTTIQIKPDGTEIIQKADGSMIQVNPDGSKMIKKPDGTTIQVQPDGTEIKSGLQPTSTS